MLNTSGVRPPRVEAESNRFSATIGVARVICLLGVVYVHAWTGLTGAALTASDGTPQGMLRWILMELLGRSAVPLLGMIAGWLVVGSVRGRTYGGFLAGKARTLILPMVLWNALAIVLVCGAVYAGLIKGPLPWSWRWVVDELLCLVTPDDINVQMSFLRDLFVCMAAAPLLVRLPRWALIGVAAGVAAWAISGAAFPLLLRPQILLFFVGGMLVRGAGLEQRIAAWPILVLAAPYAGLALAKIWLATAGAALTVAHPWLMGALDIAMRTAAAAFFWSLAWRLAATRAAAPLLRVEPYVFLMFCAHLIMIWLGGPLIGGLTGPLGSPLYPVLLLLQPPLVLLASIGIGRLLLACAPGAAFVLSGGRLKGEEMAPADCVRQDGLTPVPAPSPAQGRRNGGL